MRTILILWITPIILFWGWYGLSANDISLGSIFLSRAFHDHIFRIYGQILGMHPADVPVKLAWVFFIDTLIILAVAAFRWRASWLPQTIAWARSVSGPAPEPAELVLTGEATVPLEEGFDADHDNKKTNHLTAITDRPIDPTPPAG